VIDRITGKIRRRQDAPDAASTGASKGKPTTTAAAPTPAPSSPTVSDDDDPLKGLL
jgi:hypothetical protein